tara:strand:+ start:1759 stop:2151 length:393 start_codon:yes stop_codon:yes gene_type:complete
MTSQLERLSQKVSDAVDAMEVLAHDQFLERVKALSMRFPDRLIEAVGGNGRLYVNIYARHQRWYNRYGFAGEKFYQLNEGADMDGPDLLQSAQDYLFKEMERVQEDHSMYRNYPMVACGVVKFRNGNQLT